jgi:hypothetical protein
MPAFRKFRQNIGENGKFYLKKIMPVFALRYYKKIVSLQSFILRAV